MPIDVDQFIAQIKEQIRRLIAEPIAEGNIINYNEEETEITDGVKYVFEVMFDTEEERLLEVILKLKQVV